MMYVDVLLIAAGVFAVVGTIIETISLEAKNKALKKYNKDKP